MLSLARAFGCWLLLAAAPAYASCALPAGVPDRIGRAQIFDYGMRSSAPLRGARDLVWGSDGGPALPEGVFSSFYANVDVLYHSGGGALPGCFQPLGTRPTLACVQANFPQCVVYGADTKTPAYEFGGPAVPVAIWDSTCRGLMLPYITAMAPKFDSVAVDNIAAANNVAVPARTGICSAVPDSAGCEHAGGVWTIRYTGSGYDSRYVSDVASWLRTIKAAVQAAKPTACLWGNLTYDSGNRDNVRKLAQSLDIWLDENGVWDGCKPSTNGFGENWIKRLSDVTAWGVPFVDNNNLTDFGAGNACSAPPQVTPAELDYVIASHLLLKSSRSYLAWGQAYVGYGSYQDPFVWPYITHGAATGGYGVAGGVYYRRLANALALVNPGATPAGYDLGTALAWSLTGATYTGPITLPPVSGLVLMRDLAGALSFSK